MSSSPPGWQPDPRGRHEYRYWDGTQWTDHVSDKGEMSTDPVADTSAPPTQVQPAVTPSEPAASSEAPAAGSAAAGTPEPTPEPEPAASPAPARAEESSAAPATTGGPPPGQGRATAEPVGAGTQPGAASGPPAATGSGSSDVSATDKAQAEVRAALEAKSPDLAVLLSVIAPGSGHFYLGVEPPKRNIAIGLLVATVVAVVLATFGFIPFLIGLLIWAGAAFYAVNDIRGGAGVAGLEDASIPQQFVGILLIAGGALLIISLILPYYKVEVSAGGFDASDSFNAFDALDWEPFVLIVAGVLSIIAGLASMGIGVQADKLPEWLPRAVAIAGAIALAVIVFRLFITGADRDDVPDEVDITIGRMPGILLAADAAIVLVLANMSTLKSLRK